MEMVEIVRPTLDEYMERVRRLSGVYLGNQDLWYELSVDKILDEDDRDEFCFIRMAMWDKLVEKEFFLSQGPLMQANLFGECDQVEPGMFPGSTFLGGESWALSNTLTSLLAC